MRCSLLCGGAAQSVHLHSRGASQPACVWCFSACTSVSFERNPFIHLTRLLFLKRKSAERDSAEGGSDTAFASQGETGRAILSVLRVHQQFLQSKSIIDMRHVLTDDQRREYEQCDQEGWMQEGWMQAAVLLSLLRQKEQEFLTKRQAGRVLGKRAPTSVSILDQACFARAN